MALAHTAATLLGAVLLFSVQPLFARLVLPQLGGSAAVWTTALVFFQVVLLLGYAYAHVAMRWMGVRRQPLLHLSLLAFAALALPIRLPVEWAPPAEASPVLWQLALMVVTVGAPFFVLSGTSPIVQRWFAATRHPPATDPHFLYAASNLGSIAGLLAYPLLVEPNLSLEEQSWLWTAGYGVFALLMAACWPYVRHRQDGGTALRSDRGRPRRSPEKPRPQVRLSRSPAARAAPGAVLTLGRRSRWVLLALAPSGMTVSVTSYLSIDVAAVPLLWVGPLALYLLSFVIAFGRGPSARAGRAAASVLPFLALALALALAARVTEPMLVLVPLHLTALLVVSVACHARLAADRPPLRDLTEFYAWIAVGGALGGAFSAVLAPLLFTSVAEYPLTLVLAVLIARYAGAGAGGATAIFSRQNVLDVVLPLALGALTVALLARSQGGGTAGDLGVPVRLTPAGLALLLGVPALICLTFLRRPVRFALGVGAILLVSAWWSDSQGRVLHAERTFYGIHRVRQEVLLEAGKPTPYHVLVHGNITHGAQSLDPASRLAPLAYYHRDGPIGQVFGSLPVARDAPIAVVGLGTGSLACYGTPGQRWTYYEIDPTVARIARDTRYFTYLADCPPDVTVTIGDARLSLRSAPDHGFGGLVLDAFSSDAIPLHLMTRDALALYLAKLAPDGFLAYHVSNRYLALEPVLAALARDAGLVCLVRHDRDEPGHAPRGAVTGSSWAVMARRPEVLAPLADDARWRPAAGSGPLWTDQFASLVPVFRWH